MNNVNHFLFSKPDNNIIFLKNDLFFPLTVKNHTSRIDINQNHKQIIQIHSDKKL